MNRLAILAERARASFLAFLRLEAAAGIVLIVAAAIGMACANSPLGEAYAHALHASFGFAGGAVSTSLMHVINDGLMTLFFLVVGLELKREMREGQLRDSAKLVLPLLCAAAGMVVPMLIYAAINRGDATAMRGVAIPAATDIAFALGVLALLGSRVPFALKLLLTAIAVLDDLGAIVLIAVFYTQQLSVAALAVAAVALGVLVALNRAGVTRLAPYLAVGVVLWLAVLKSGVHATLAGVALGMTVPLAVARDPEARPADRLEHALHPWVAYGVLPIFAFANAGVPLAGLTFASLATPVPAGVALGLVLGKPIGIFGAGWLAVRFGLARAPDGVGAAPLFGMAVLCGIGFTMSLFIGALAFEGVDASLMVANRIGILSGSLVAAIAGYGFLRLVLPAPRAAD